MTSSNLESLNRIYTRARRAAQQRLYKLTGPRLVSAHTLSEKAFLAKFDPARLGLANGPVTRKELLDHYGERIGANTDRESASSHPQTFDSTTQLSSSQAERSTTRLSVRPSSPEAAFAEGSSQALPAGPGLQTGFVTRPCKSRN